MYKFIFTSSRPIYIQLVEQLQSYIISGRVPPGAKLPSVRELALIAKVNPNTMQRALTELEEAGLIYTERTNGKFVTNKTRKIIKMRHAFIHQQVDDFLDNMQKLGFTKRDIIKILKTLE